MSSTNKDPFSLCLSGPEDDTKRAGKWIAEVYDYTFSPASQLHVLRVYRALPINADCPI